MKLISILILVFLSGCATRTHKRCVEYMWVPVSDGGHPAYHVDRPVCTMWSDK